MQDFLAFLDAVDGFLYYPVLIVVLIAGGLYFSFKSKFAQVRLVFDSVRTQSHHSVRSWSLLPLVLVLETSSAYQPQYVSAAPVRYSGCGFSRLSEGQAHSLRVHSLRCSSSETPKRDIVTAARHITSRA